MPARKAAPRPNWSAVDWQQQARQPRPVSTPIVPKVAPKVIKPTGVPANQRDFGAGN